jgi:hypothetical protein
MALKFCEVLFHEFKLHENFATEKCNGHNIFKYTYIYLFIVCSLSYALYNVLTVVVITTISVTNANQYHCISV